MAEAPIPPLNESLDPGSVPEPQPVVEQQGMAAHFIVLGIAPGQEAADKVRAFFGNAAGLVRSVGRRQSEDRLSMVVGIGAKAWDRLFGQPRPAGLHPFKALRGDKHQAPSTPGDILLHIRAMNERMCFELNMQIMRALEGAVQPVDEVHGFRYFDARAMVGFVDGVENPDGREAWEATLIGDEDPAFAGGSYVIVQKYLHDMTAWNAISIEEQERVIGRTKLEDVELADDIKPANSHVALNVVEDDNGDQLQIVRANMPFGRVGTGEYGTFYIGYSRTPKVTETMLHNMFIGNPPGNTDRILDFSTAITGTLFFTPTADFLDNPPPLPGTAAAAATPVSATAPDGSLTIGSLKGRS